MRNKVYFAAGFIFSLWFSFSALSYIANFVPAKQMLTMALAVPHKEKAHNLASYSSEDLKCLQENIFFEARNQEPIGMTMVGIVTLQRSKMPQFPNTICGVVYQRYQFSWTQHPKSPNLKNSLEAKAWTMSGNIAKNILDNNETLDKIYKNVAYYHKTTITPKWSLTMNKEFVLKDHVFYSKG